MTGFEPATSGSTIRRSNQLSYTHHEDEKEDISKEPNAVATIEQPSVTNHVPWARESLFMLSEYDF